MAMTRSEVLFHVTASTNRESIERHGLDWHRMSAAPGIAGSTMPEKEGIFLARDRSEVDWFIEMAGWRGVDELDIWEVVSAQLPLLESSEGYIYTTQPIPRSQIRLLPWSAPALSDT
jgi:hypothetical protein